jgi:hypothetical protein
VSRHASQLRLETARYWRVMRIHHTAAVATTSPDRPAPVLDAGWGIPATVLSLHIEVGPVDCKHGNQNRCIEQNGKGALIS